MSQADDRLLDYLKAPPLFNSSAPAPASPV
ncbi:hypothetical protein SFUMM280S_03469 [Streptomyces fumanus]